MRYLVAALVALTLVQSASAQSKVRYKAAPPEFFEYLSSLQNKEPLEGNVVDEDTLTVCGRLVRLNGAMKPVKLPARYAQYHVVAVGEDESAYLFIERGEYYPLPPIFFPYRGRDGKNKVPSKIAPLETLREGDEIVGYKNPKALPGAGWFVWAHTIEGGESTKVAGENAPPAAYFDAIFEVEGQNPLKAPTLDEDLIAIDGMKLRVEKPAKFMALPEEAKGFWAAAVPGGKPGAVLVDSPRWNVGFLPFEKGKTKGNPIQPLKGEPIVVNDAVVGWRFAKPSPAGGWFVATGLMPENDGEGAVDETQVP